MMMVDNVTIRLPKDEQLIHEFEIFSYNMTEGQRIQYSAPDGQHDDIVISVALTAWGLDRAFIGCIGMTDTKPIKDDEGKDTESYYDEDSVFNFWDEEDDIVHNVNTVKRHVL
jgi:hypothetical protein